MIKIELCKSCGNPYDAEEIQDGYCLECQPETAPVLALATPRDIYDLEAE